MEGRYGEGGRKEGGFFNTLQENNPTFDNSMYKDLLLTIESKREEWTANQIRLTSIHEQLRNLKDGVPSGWFLYGKVLPEMVLVTSAKTHKAFETREDNEEVLNFKSDTTKKK